MQLSWKIDKRLVKGLLLVLAAAASHWLLQGATPVAVTPSVVSEDAPDYYAKKVSIHVMGAQGVVEKKLTADRMTHHPKDNSVEYQQPHLMLYQAAIPQWDIRANNVVMKEGSHLFSFMGDVLVNRLSLDSGDYLMVATQNLQYHTEQQLAVSDEKVAIYHSAGVTRGEGLRVDLPSQRMELLNEVRGVYELSR